MNGVMQRHAFWIAMVPVALLVGVYLYYTLSNASYTLGCDYLAYDDAARRWLAGARPYDLSITSTGDCGTYQYPPAFMLLVLPFLVCRHMPRHGPGSECASGCSPPPSPSCQSRPASG